MENTCIIVASVFLLLILAFSLHFIINNTFKNAEPKKFDFIEVPDLGDKLYRELRDRFPSDYILIEGNSKEKYIKLYKHKIENISTFNFKFIKDIVFDINIPQKPRLFFDINDLEKFGEDKIYNSVLKSILEHY